MDQRETNTTAPPPLPPLLPTPLEVVAAPVTPAEGKHVRSDHICGPQSSNRHLYGHISRDCPGKTAVVNQTWTEDSSYMVAGMINGKTVRLRTLPHHYLEGVHTKLSLHQKRPPHDQLQ